MRFKHPEDVNDVQCRRGCKSGRDASFTVAIGEVRDDIGGDVPRGQVF